MRWGWVALLVALWGGDVSAAVTATPVFCQTPKNNVVQFLQGTDSAGTYKTVVTAGSNGTKCVAVWATTNDDASHLVTVQIERSSVKYGGTAVTVAASSGFAAATPALNLMSAANWPGLPFDADGNPFLYLESGDLLRATFATAFSTAGELINVVVACCDF